MKHCLLFIGLLLLGAWGPQRARAQAPAWQSARTVAVATATATNNFSTVQATAVDAAGNVYLAGYFTNTVLLGNISLTSAGSDDLYVAKFSPASNQFVWAQRAGGTGSDRASALAVSGSSVYVAGTFDSPTASVGATTLTNAGFSDVFVAKLTDAGSTGSFAWAQRAGGADTDQASALAVSGTSVYVAGLFISPAAEFGTATLAPAGSYDAFVAKLTDAGSTARFSWAQRAGGTDTDQVYALAVNGPNVYAAGTFSSPTADFGATALATAGGADAFVAKLTDAGSTGSFAWAQRAGGTGYDAATGLAVNGTSVYVAGTVSNPTASVGATTLTSAGFADVFVAKLTDAGSTGSFGWAQRAGGTGYDVASALAVSGASVYVTGYFSGAAADFGATVLSTAGGPDVFVTKLTDAGSMGSFAWAQRAGGTYGDNARTLALGGSSVYVGGQFSSSASVFGATTLANPGGPILSLGFLASLADATLTATTAPIGPREPAVLFPNPARYTVALRLPAGTAPAPLALTDALGRTVRRYPAPAGAEAALDLAGLPAGLYLLRGAGPARRLTVE